MCYEDDHMCGDYEPEFDAYVNEQVRQRTCNHSDAWNILADYEGNKQRHKCFCPDCSTEVTYESLCPSFHHDWETDRMERASEQAFEDRLYGVTD